MGLREAGFDAARGSDIFPDTLAPAMWRRQPEGIEETAFYHAAAFDLQTNATRGDETPDQLGWIVRAGIIAVVISTLQVGSQLNAHPEPEHVRARNNVRFSGRGERVMMFAHGFGCDQTKWRLVAPAFEADYRIVMFDYVGCGKSDWSAFDVQRYGSLHGYAQDVLDILNAFDLRDVVFVGHSVSAMIGMLASIEEPQRFSRLIHIGPSPCYVNDAGYIGGFERSDIEGLLDLMEKNYVGWAAFLAPVVMKNPGRAELTEELQSSFCATDPRVTRQFARVTFFSDNRADLAKLTVPSHILQCSDDAIAPQSVGLYLQSAMPMTTFRQMSATGHCPHMSHPAETIALMKECLQQAS